MKMGLYINLKTRIKKILANSDFILFRKFSSGELISFVLLYFISFLLNANFTEENLGKFSYSYNLLLLIYPFFALNFFEAYLVFFAKNDIDQIKLESIIKKVSIFGTILMFFVVFMFTKNLMLCSLSFIILFNERLYLFRGKLLTYNYRILKTISSSLCFGFILLLVYFQKLTFDLAIGAYGFSYLITALIGHFIDRNKKEITTGAIEISFTKIAKYTLPIMASSIMTWILSVSDQYFIEHYYNYEDLAKYSIANRSLNVIRIFTGFFLIYWPMFYFKEFEAKNYLKIKKVRLLFITGIGILSLSLIIFGKVIYLILGARKYVEFVAFFRMLVLAEFFRIIAGIFLTFRSLKLQSYYSLIIIFIVAIFNVTLNYFFIKPFGVKFAALSTLLSMVLYLLLSLVFGYYPERILKRENR